MASPIQKQLLATYFTLRIGIAVTGAALPFLLWLGGKYWAGVPLQNSLSAYYHALGPQGLSMRDWFVGILFAVGACLYLYKGFSMKENVALNIAGVLSVCVALNPMPWPGTTSSRFPIHYVCAISFFLCIAFVAIFCSGDSLDLIHDPKIRARYRRIYIFMALLMLTSPISSWIVNDAFRRHEALVFYLEAVGILAFSAYWLTKTIELSHTEAEKRIIRGEVVRNPIRGRLEAVSMAGS